MKKTFCILLAVCMMAALLAGCGSNNKERVPEASTAETATAFEPVAEENKEYADIVVYGTIFTAENEENETVEAFAVKDGITSMNTPWKMTPIGRSIQMLPQMILYRKMLSDVPVCKTEIIAEETMTGFTVKAIFVLFMRQRLKTENTPA